MSLTGKLEAAVEINSTGELFYEMFCEKPNEISNLKPELLQTCTLEKGEFGKPGSIFSWKYVDSEGKTRVAKEEVEVADKEKKLVKLRVTEGDLMEFYKSLTITVQVLPKGDNNSTVNWTVDYEKVGESVPEPKKFLDGLVYITKAIEG